VAVRFVVVALAIGFGAVQVLAEEPKKVHVITNDEVGVPVFPHDITDRPYKVLGEVKAEVRKATVFSKAPDQAKIYRELWERGEKLGADAVIKAQYGDARVTMMSWGSSAATGVAVKFVEAADPAAAPAATPPAQ
jgi:uncharacterized protein YbjQ (UPF0145 family)